MSHQSSVGSIDDRLSSIFHYTGREKVGVDALRSSYVSSMNWKVFWWSIYKIFLTTQEEKQTEPSVIVVKSVDESLLTERQYKRTKKYDEENRQKELAQQQEYQGENHFLKRPELRCYIT